MEEPLDLLMACHERIHRFLGGLDALAAAEDLDGAPARATAAQCRRYFAEALPLHAADEDESLAPRLGGAAVATMQAEHVEIEALLPVVVDVLGQVADGRPVARHALQGCALRLGALLRRHVAAEEAEVFPLLAGLPDGERAAIVAEMRARRAAR